MIERGRFPKTRDAAIRALWAVEPDPRRVSALGVHLAHRRFAKVWTTLVPLVSKIGVTEAIPALLEIVTGAARPTRIERSRWKRARELSAIALKKLAGDDERWRDTMVSCFLDPPPAKRGEQLETFYLLRTALGGPAKAMTAALPLAREALASERRKIVEHAAQALAVLGKEAAAVAPEMLAALERMATAAGQREPPPGYTSSPESAN